MSLPWAVPAVTIPSVVSADVGEVLVRGSQGSARFASLATIAIALAACGLEPTEAANTQSARKQVVASPASGSSASVRTATSMPATALFAWTQFARARCRGGFRAPRLVQFVDFDRTPNGFMQADFNGDRQPDFIVITPGEGCGGSGRIDYGSSGGPPANFVVSTPGGYRTFEGFGDYLSPKMIERRGARDVLNLRFMRNVNGRCGPVTSAIWGWNGSTIDLIERRNPSGQLVDEEGCLLRSTARPAAAQASSGGLPIRTGYYAVNEPNCAAALRSDLAGVVIDGRFLRDVDGDYPITPVRNLGNGRYRMGQAFETIRVINANSFVADEGRPYQRRFLWCAERAPR